MTVSYKKSGKAGAAYYTEHSSEVDDYYTAGEKEPPGVWYVSKNQFGNRHTNFGIEDGLSFSAADSKKFAALSGGFNPETGEQLVQNANSEKRIALHDFTLSPPKSVSVVWSQAGDELKQKIETAQSDASKNFLDYISQHAVGRKGAQGVLREKAFIRGAMFNHGSSRENDPQLHTHCVVMNVVELEDGSTPALEAVDMLRWQGAAASLYHADLAHQLREAGLPIKKIKNLFEIDGVPEEVLKEFSRRRQAILKAVEKEMEDRGLDASQASRGLFQKATFETRQEKSEMSRYELIVIWKERGAALGFTEDQVNELIDLEKPVELTAEQCKAEVKNVADQILQMKAVFGEPELVAKAASSMIGMASREQILSAVEEYKKELLVSHGEQARDTVFTSRDMVTLEHEMLELCENRSGRHVIEDFKLPESLSEEQRVAAEGVLRDENDVTVVEGTAGAGKTYTMASVARAYEENGYRVVGMATAWTAALNLKNDADLDDGQAITGWLNSVRKGETRLDEKTLVILDEAGMTSARQMRDVLQVVREHGAKLVLLGDTKQQKAVEAGAGLGPIAQKLGSHRLNEIRRQNRVEEREAVKQLFDGRAAEALKTFAKREGGVKVLDSDDELNQQMVDDWAASRSRGIGDTVKFSRDGRELEGEIVHQDGRFWTVSDGESLHKVERSHLMLATDNRSVQELNRLAQERLKEAGALGEGRVLDTMHGEQVFHVGDHIQFRNNVRDANVFNRTWAMIERFEGETMFVRTADDRQVKVNLNDPAWRNEEGQMALQLAYATTVYSSQGLTVGHCFVKDGWSLARDSAGVAMSRHREAATVYANRLDHHERAMRKLPADQWRSVRDFTDEDVLETMAKNWSRENEKASTLNHIWQDSSGAHVSRAALLAEQKEAEKAAVAQDQKQVSTKPLPELKEASQVQLDRALDRLEQAGIHQDAIKMAAAQGVLGFDPGTGEPVFCGRREDGALMQVLPFEAAGKAKPDVRGRFPPILRGEGDETLVVKDGMAALQKMTEYLDARAPTPNIIITGGKPFALSGEQAKSLLDASKAAARAEKRSTQEALAQKMEAASRRSQAALQQTLAPETEKGLNR